MDEVEAGITRPAPGADMRRMQIQHQGQRRDDLEPILPVDPRDPGVGRAKQLKRGESRPTRRRVR